jgi:hypothetical protein
LEEGVVVVCLESRKVGPVTCSFFVLELHVLADLNVSKSS